MGHLESGIAQMTNRVSVATNHILEAAFESKTAKATRTLNWNLARTE